MTSTLGVCSWSLRCQSPSELVDRVSALGLDAVQLHLDPVRTWQWRPDETASRLKVARIAIASGMMSFKGEDYATLESIKATGGVRLDETWAENLRAAEGNAIMAYRFGIKLVTFHAGFLPHEKGDPERSKMIERLRQIIDIFAARQIDVAFETGQESAETLLEVLEELDRPTVGVNFDPANMILYAMGDPVAALRKLARHVRQIHVKDAVKTTSPGSWGSEVRVGTGGVDWKSFFSVVRGEGINCNFMIEREAGEERDADIAAARDLVRPFMA